MAQRGLRRNLNEFCGGYGHDFTWEDSDITPQWRLKADRENEIDFELYEVAVCHKCYFASCRIENFTVTIPEGTIPTVLTKDQKDRLVKRSSVRANLIAEQQKSNVKSFISMPREGSAGFLSWQLYDKTIRDLAKDRSNTVAIEVARANILSAKYAINETERDKALTTAHVWLADILNNPNSHSTRDLVAAHVFLVSVSLALNKVKDAHTTANAFLERFEEDEHYEFWVERARYLIKD